MTQVTLTSKPGQATSRFEGNVARTLRYEVLTNIVVGGQPTLPTFSGWFNTRHIVSGGSPTTRTIQLEAGKATRLYRYLKMCAIDGRSARGSLGIVEIIMDRDFMFVPGIQVEGRPTNVANIATGMPYVLVDGDNNPLYGFMGLAPNLGLSCSRRGLGPAITSIDRLSAYLGARGVWSVLGTQSR